MSTPLLLAGHPATFPGVSRRSNGSSQVSLRKVGKAGLDEVKAFKEESSNDEGAALIDLVIPSSDALSLDMLDLALMGHSEHTAIDWKAWLQRLRKHFVKMPRPRYLHATASLESYCRIKGLIDILHTVNTEMPFAGSETIPDETSPPQASRLRFRRIEVSNPVTLKTVSDASSLIDEILGQHYPEQGMRYVKWLGALCRAYRATVPCSAKTDATLKPKESQRKIS